MLMHRALFIILALATFPFGLWAAPLISNNTPFTPALISPTDGKNPVIAVERGLRAVPKRVAYSSQDNRRQPSIAHYANRIAKFYSITANA